MEKNKEIETVVEAEGSGQMRDRQEREVEGPRAGLRDRGRPQQAA